MLYAVPVTGGILSSHFGHCEQFALIKADETAKTIVEKNMVIPPPHEPGLLPKWLSEKGVNVIIAGGMGGRAQDLFTQYNIKVVVGAMENDPEQAVLNHLQGTLQTGNNACDH